MTAASFPITGSRPPTASNSAFITPADAATAGAIDDEHAAQVLAQAAEHRPERRHGGHRRLDDRRQPRQQPLDQSLEAGHQRLDHRARRP